MPNLCYFKSKEKKISESNLDLSSNNYRSNINLSSKIYNNDLDNNDCSNNGFTDNKQIKDLIDSHPKIVIVTEHLCIPCPRLYTDIFNSVLIICNGISHKNGRYSEDITVDNTIHQLMKEALSQWASMITINGIKNYNQFIIWPTDRRNCKMYKIDVWGTQRRFRISM